ncbi:MAG: response regulator [Tannerellaceae bacterium]|jgi:signal transduction histidine kinase/ligand-binding sensor domain-containing protein/DNA-binding response OmpR family regulator|nr:response regulator [Tannerellaceae bacterium]
MSGRRWLIVAFLALLLAGVLHREAEANELYFRHYNNKHGLSHNTVSCSLQDSRGFLWFGTEDGLNRFDGHTFKVYRHNSYLPNGLPDNRIVRLFEDSEGKIWVCTAYYTCYYDDRTDSFYPFTLVAGNDTPDYFDGIAEDGKKNLWCIDYNRIVRYSLSDHSFRIYPASSFFHPGCMAVTAGEEPLFSSMSDLYRYRQETDDFTLIPILSEEEKREQVHISALCRIPDFGVLIGTDKAGLKRYSYLNRTIETVIPAIQVRAITAYSATVYWVASESGVYILNVMDQSVTHLTKSLTNEYTLADNAVYSLTKDREGGMWIGSFFGGISYLPRQYTRFNRFIGGKTHVQMVGNAVREICPDAYGNLWLGTEDNGINRYNPQTGAITNFSLTNPSHPLSATNIHGLLADGDRLWVGSFNKGIDLLELPSGKLIKRYTQAGTHNGLPSDFVLCFHKRANGDLLIGTSSGVVLFDRKTETFQPWQDLRSLVRQIYTDQKDRIWVVTLEGLYCYRPDEDALIRYQAGRHQSRGLGSDNCTSVFEDSKGRIWVATANGFSLYHEITDSFNRITVEDGLPSNIVYRILEDGDRLFWISTANGLVKFNPETHAMRTFTYTDGLHETQFNYSSSYKAPDGTLYMGTINGMISFNPRRFEDDMFEPPVYITNIHLPGDKLPLRGDMKRLRLPYHASTFTLSYVALSFTSPDAIRYAYILEGSDTEWNDMGRNKDVTFANLAPGNYTFKVKSTNSSGVWQENETALSIVIVPPFWATGWAFLLYGVLIGLLIAAFYRYKKSKLEEKHRMNREIFENEKEKELYQAKIRFFTFITHEIRTPLTLIKAPLEKILQSDDNPPATKKNLHTIEKNTQRLLDLSNQLLDFRKAEGMGFKLHFVGTDITLWMESIIQRFKPTFEKDGKRLTVGRPDEPLYACIDREAFSKIITNLLTNALKYSDKHIGIAWKLPEEGYFAVSVTNDGILVPEGEAEKIFAPFYRLKATWNIQGSGIGLSLARSLAEFHKGSLSYGRTAGGLNCFTLRLPSVQEERYSLQPPGDPEDPGAVASIPDNGKPAILIVEDQEEMRRFIADELSGSYAVLEADNGRSALHVLDRNNVKLIISDVMMPVMDGFDLCNAVKNDINFSHIPFIILTAQHNLQSRLTGLNNGADAYIEKPFSIELLTGQVANLLKSREILNRTYLEKPLTSTLSLAPSPIDEIFLDKFNHYIEANLTNEHLTVEILASEMHMSASSLYRKVKGLSGLSPVDFIRVVRLKKAVQLIQGGETRISEVAFKTGFSSPAYFSTCFQKQYGKSPSGFIKEKR